MADAICSFPGCDKPLRYVRAQLCGGHYRQQRLGKPLKPLHVPPVVCSVQGCEKPSRKRGWCVAHYYRWRAHGDVHHGGEIGMVFGDPEEAFHARTERRGSCLIWTGATDDHGYGLIVVDGAIRRAHRYAWERENGPIPEGIFLDHRYHCDTACCEIGHLRLATNGENNANRSGARSKRKHDLPRNVYRGPRRLFVSVTKGGKAYSFGSFDSVEEAAQVAEQARAELFGKFAGRG